MTEVEAATYWLGWIKFAKNIGAFLVAVGVAAEFLGDFVAKPFEDKIDAARNEELAKLNNETAKLSADAESSRAAIADANARAMEAKLELARLTTPRTISPEQKEQIVNAIRPFSATPFDIFLQAEPEPLALMEQISEALVEAGWEWQGVPQIVALVRPGKPKVGLMTSTGIQVQIDSSKIADWERPILALANALATAGLEGVAAQQVDDGSVDATAVHVRIGKKP
jgi:hypothetical protein